MPMIKFTVLQYLGTLFSFFNYETEKLNFEIMMLKRRYMLQHELLDLSNESDKLKRKKVQKDLFDTENKIIDGLAVFCKKQNAAIKLYNRTYEKYFNKVLLEIQIPSLPKREEIKISFNKFCKIKFLPKDYPDFDRFYDSSFSNFLSSIITPIITYSYESDKTLKRIIDSFELDTVPKKYKNQIVEVLDLFFLNYSQTALLVLGRIFEEIVTKLLYKSTKSGKINKTKAEIDSFNFETKINILNSHKLITEKEYLLFKKLKWDRNIGGHFSKKKDVLDVNNESEQTIKLCIQQLSRKK